jgi:hypothetical protein
VRAEPGPLGQLLLRQASGLPARTQIDPETTSRLTH